MTDKYDPTHPENLDDDALAIELTQLEEREAGGALEASAPRLSLVRDEFQRRFGDQ